MWLFSRRKQWILHCGFQAGSNFSSWSAEQSGYGSTSLRYEPKDFACTKDGRLGFVAQLKWPGFRTMWAILQHHSSWTNWLHANVWWFQLGSSRFCIVGSYSSWLPDCRFWLRIWHVQCVAKLEPFVKGIVSTIQLSDAKPQSKLTSKAHQIKNSHSSIITRKLSEWLCQDAPVPSRCEYKGLLQRCVLTGLLDRELLPFIRQWKAVRGIQWSAQLGTGLQQSIWCACDCGCWASNWW